MQGTGKRDEKIDFPCAEGERDSHSEAVRGMYKENQIINRGGKFCRPEKISGLFQNKEYTVLLKEAHYYEKTN